MNSGSRVGGGHGDAAGRFLNSKPQELTNGEETIIEEIFQAVSNYIHKHESMSKIEIL